MAKRVEEERAAAIADKPLNIAGETDPTESQQLPLAPLTCSAPIAVEIRKAIDSINRHIDYIDVERGGYSADVKQKAYKDRSKLVDALIAMVPTTQAEPQHGNR